MAPATLTINSKNYGAWSLRGWLLCKMAGLEFEEHVLDNDDPDTRAELLLLSSSFLVPKLVHDGVTVWDTMAIGEYLNELRPEERQILEMRFQGHSNEEVAAKLGASDRKVRRVIERVRGLAQQVELIPGMAPPNT